jgi:hypothetical protein
VIFNLKHTLSSIIGSLEQLAKRFEVQLTDKNVATIPTKPLKECVSGVSKFLSKNPSGYPRLTNETMVQIHINGIEIANGVAKETAV